jgi:hypothetical protein
MKVSRIADPRRTPQLLCDDDLRHVAGGRKAGKGQMEFMTYSMKDALIGAFSSES